VVVVPPPEEDETPEEDEIPDEEDVPVDDDPEDEDDPPRFRWGSAAVKCANFAPMTAAAAADSRPTRQVIFLTRRRPSSRARASLEYWVRVTAQGSPAILCGGTDALLRNVRIAIAPPCHAAVVPSPSKSWAQRLPGPERADMVMKSRA
jgi:hypothetical protein